MERVNLVDEVTVVSFRDGAASAEVYGPGRVCVPADVADLLRACGHVAPGDDSVSVKE